MKGQHTFKAFLNIVMSQSATYTFFTISLMLAPSAGVNMWGRAASGANCRTLAQKASASFVIFRMSGQAYSTHRRISKSLYPRMTVYNMKNFLSKKKKKKHPRTLRRVAPKKPSKRKRLQQCLYRTNPPSLSQRCVSSKEVFRT